MTSLVKKLLSSGIVRAGRAATDADIQAAQLELGVKFPGSYKEFLRTVGVLTIYDSTVFGLRPAAKRLDASSTVYQTKRFRDWSRTRLPSRYVVLWHDCHEDCECLDTDRIRGRECPIVNFSHSQEDPEEVVVKELCGTLAEWLLLKVDDRLKVKRLLDLVMR